MAQSDIANKQGSVELLDYWLSLFAMRVKLALAAKGVSYTCIQQEIGSNNKSPLLLLSNPVHKKVPVLLHNHKPICESMLICEYVDEAFPPLDGCKNLLPKDPYLRATARFWADFADKKVLGTLVKLIQGPREDFLGLIEETKEYLQTLEDGAFHADLQVPFFGGGDLGFVDVVLGPLVVVLPAVEGIVDEGEDVFELRKLPRLQAWLKALGDLPLARIFLPTPAKMLEGLKGFRKMRFPHEN